MLEWPARHAGCQLTAYAFEVSLKLLRAGQISLKFLRACQSGLDMRKDIFPSDVMEKAGARDAPRGLVAGAAEQKGFACLVQAGGELLEGVNAGCVESGHVAKPQDDDLCKLIEVAGDVGELFGGAEEEGAVNAKDGDVGGDVLVLQDVRLAVGEVLGGDGRDGRGLGDAVDVEECGEGHADSDGYGEVGQHGEGESCDPDGEVGLGVAKDCGDLPPL